jgi:hypothetical protein
MQQRCLLRNVLRRRARLDYSRHHLARAPASPSGRPESISSVSLPSSNHIQLMSCCRTAIPNMGRCLLLLALLSGWVIATEQTHAPRDSHNDEDLVPGTENAGSTVLCSIAQRKHIVVVLTAQHTRWARWLTCALLCAIMQHARMDGQRLSVTATSIVRAPHEENEGEHMMHHGTVPHSGSAAAHLSACLIQPAPQQQQQQCASTTATSSSPKSSKC